MPEEVCFINKRDIMRSKILILCILSAVCSITAKSQIKPDFGARLSMEVTVPGGGSSYYKTGAGFSVGGVMKLELPRNFYFEPGLLFYYTAMSSNDLIPFDDYYYQGAVKEYGLRLPLNVGYTFDSGKIWTIDVYTGPWINFNISATQALDPNFSNPEPVPDKTINMMKHGWKRVDAMWGFGLSFTFAENYHIGLSGGIGFTPLAKFGNRDKTVRIHRNIVAISLGYNF